MEYPYWQALSDYIRGKKVLVYGLGLQGGGVGVANTLFQAGADVHVTDAKSSTELESSIEQLHPGIAGKYGSNSFADQVAWAEIIVKNPGVPYEHPDMQSAIAAGKLVVTEGILALRFVRDRTIGITGTRGKSTTTTLIHHILTTAGVPALLCGNIPEKPTLAALQEATADTWFVIEFSSFTLEAAHYLPVSPHIAVVTNVYPDHLNRYASIEEYARTKAEIFAHQLSGDHAFFGDHHSWGQVLAQAIPSNVTSHRLGFSDFSQVSALVSQLPGNHNRENIAFAVAVSQTFGIAQDNIERGVASFGGVPFRLQLVDEKNGVRFINDTTSTTPIALEKALQSIPGKFVLIAGGTSKKLPFSAELLALLEQQAPSTILLDGSGTRELLETLHSSNRHVPEIIVGRLSEAVEQAVRLAHEQGAQTILFSPGFSSFELFTNEFDRGRQFNELVDKL